MLAVDEVATALPSAEALQNMQVSGISIIIFVSKNN
jgi:hypothetical protein